MKFKLYEISNAPEKSKAVLEKGKATYGIVPNLWASMAESPALLNAYTMAYDTFLKDTILDAKEQQIVALTVSQKNECAYCIAAHSAVSRKVGVDEKTIKSIKENNPLENPKHEALRIVTRSLVEKKGLLSDQEVSAFLATGYTQQHLLDVLLGVGVKILSNYTSHLTKTPIDKMFQS